MNTEENNAEVMYLDDERLEVSGGNKVNDGDENNEKNASWPRIGGSRPPVNDPWKK